MAIEPDHGRGRPWSLLFVAVAAAFAWRFWELRYWLVNFDEAFFIGEGWMLARGARLYDTSLSQHMPLCSILTTPLARAGLVLDPAPYRQWVTLAQLLAGLALALSPAWGRRRAAGWAAGSLYLAFYAALAPLQQGHVFSGYAVAGAAWTICFACLILPLALGRAPGGLAAFFGGAAFGVWAGSSPIMVFAGTATLVALALAPPPRRAWMLPALGGLGAVVLGQLAWLGLHGDFRGWFEQVIVFNSKVYPALNREPSGWAVPLDSMVRAWGSLTGLGDPLNAFDAAGVAGAAILAWRATDRRQRAMLAALAMAYILLRTRSHLWKTLPFRCAGYACMAALVAGAPALASGLRRAVLAALGLLWALWTIALGHRLVPYGVPMDDWHRGPAAETAAALRSVTRALPEGSTMVALHHRPDLYLLSGLPCGIHTSLYGPGAFGREFGGSVPAERDLCTELARSRPALLYVNMQGTLFHVPPTEFTPPCVPALLNDAYRPIDAWPHWWIRTDLEPRLPKVLPPLPKDA